MKILHAPSNIANQAWGSVIGLRTLGHDAEVWHYGVNRFGFSAHRVIEESRDPSVLLRVMTDALGEDFDVFHFHYARSLIPATSGLPLMWDLPVLRALGKRIVFTFHGSDVRKRAQHMEQDPWSYFRFADIPCDEEAIEKRLAIIRTYATGLVVAGAPLLDFVPDATYVPKVIDLADITAGVPPNHARPLVVHAPSSRASKGTDFVLREVDALQSRGVSFDFRLAEGLSHTAFLELLSEADIVVDNLLMGDCEVSALEAMALGKPVVTRILERVLDEHPDLPAVHADPETFGSTLESLLADPRRRADLGEQGRLYVEKDHSPAVVAERLLRIYEAPSTPTTRTFPEWVPSATDKRILALEERAQNLEKQNAAYRNALDERNRVVDRLKERLAKMESHPVMKMQRALNRRRKTR